MGRPTRRLTGTRFEVRWLRFSADGRVAAAADTAGGLAAWEVATGRPLNAGAGNLGTLIDFELSPTGDRLLAVPTGSATVIVDLRDGSRSALRSVAFPEFQGRLAVGGDGNLLAFTRRAPGPAMVMDLQRHAVVTTLPGTADFVEQLLFAPGTRRLAASYQGAAGQLVDVWELGGSPFATTTFVPQRRDEGMVAMSDDGRLVAVADSITLRVWDVRSGRPVGTPLPHAAAWLGAAGFAAGGTRLRTFEQDAAAEARYVLRDRASGRVLGSALIGEKAEARAVSGESEIVSPDGARVALEHERKPLVLLHVVAPARADTVADPAARAARDGCLARPLAFTPDGALLAFQGCAGRVLLWDVAARAVRDSIVGLPQAAVAVAFNADASVVAVSDFDAVHFYRRGAPRQLAEVPRRRIPGGASGMIALSPDGGRAAFVGQEGTVFLADVRHGQVLGPVNVMRARSVVGLAFVDGGRRLVVASSGGIVSSIELDPARWAERACRVATSDRVRARWARIAPATAAFPEPCDAAGR
jgi:WD40 repeat protein